jgi:uncharacterized protein
VIRAVVDPSVLVSAFIGRPDAGPGRLVAAWRDQRFELVVSPLLLQELAGVLARPKFERWAGEGRAAAYVAGFAARSDRRPDPEIAEPSVRDPADDYLVALARAEQVAAIVSLDRDLLDAGLGDIPVEDPASFVARLS